MRIYIAGLYSRNQRGGEANIIEIFENIRIGCQAAAEIFDLGHSPFCPWYDYNLILFSKQAHSPDHTRFKQYSLDWLEPCDAIVMLPGWEQSGGARTELDYAKLLGLKVYMSMDELRAGITKNTGENNGQN